MVIGAIGEVVSATAVVAVAAGAVVAVGATSLGAASVGARVGALVDTGAEVGASGVADAHAERIKERTINKDRNEKNLFNLNISSPWQLSDLCISEQMDFIGFLMQRIKDM
jgi:hypothetical protein